MALTTMTMLMMVASTAMQVMSTRAAGKAEQAAGQARQQALEHQAKQARQNAGQERASAQRAAIEERRQASFVASKAQARGAASGAGGPGLVNILGGIGEEGEFRALSALFEGEESALRLETQADMNVFAGNQARRAGDIARSASNRQSIGQALSGGARVGSMYEKYAKTTADDGEGLSRYGAPIRYYS